MKILISLIMVVVLYSCGRIERLATGITGSLTYKCSRSGVEYVQSDSGLAIHVEKNGSPVLCDKE